MLTYIAAARVLEFVLNGIEQYTGVTIVAEHSDAIRKVITEKLGWGVTMYQGKSGYGEHGELGHERRHRFHCRHAPRIARLAHGRAGNRPASLHYPVPH